MYRLRCDPCAHLYPSQDNALCDDKSYRPTVLRKMRSLQWFDGLEVTAAEKETFADATGGITLAMVQSAGMSGGRWGKTGSVQSLGLIVFRCPSWCPVPLHKRGEEARPRVKASSSQVLVAP